MSNVLANQPYQGLPKQHVDLLVVGRDPRNPVKVSQEGGEVVGEPRPNERGASGDNEVLFSRHGSTSGFSGTLIFNRVKSVEKRGVDKC